MPPLMFLLKLAWDCRFRLPLLITVGFMVLDVRMQLNINVQTRRVPRPRPAPQRMIVEVLEDGTSSEESWSTIDENSESEM